jgi:hypothetical protein
VYALGLVGRVLVGRTPAQRKRSEIDSGHPTQRGGKVVHARLQDWHLVTGLVDGRPAVLVRDPGDPSKMPAYFVLLDWQATVSSASEISFRTSKLAMSRKPIIYRKRPILLPGGGACQWVSIPMYECARSKAARVIGPFGPESMSTGAGEQA